MRIALADSFLHALARHDQAYVWAREHCLDCDPLTSEIDVVEWGGGARA